MASSSPPPTMTSDSFSEKSPPFIVALVVIDSNSASSDLSSSSSEQEIQTYAELYYRQKSGEDDKLRTLLAMLIGLECSDLRKEFDNHVKAGRIQKSVICLRGKIEYMNEIPSRRPSWRETPSETVGK